jgi:Ca2+/Na+ antiporter
MMAISKKVVLYSFAIVIALLMSFNIGLSTIELVFLIGFLVLLMVLFMIVFLKQEKENAEKEEKQKRIQFDVEEIIEKNTKLCIYCQTSNKKTAAYCRKCKRSLEDITCPVCGHENAYDQKYCEECQSILQNKKVHL